MEPKKRILIADNHRLVAEACKQILEPEFTVVGVVTDGRALVEMALNRRPDGAILEIFLPMLNGLDAAERLKHKLPSLKLVFLTGNPDVDVAAEAFRRGASAYILKHSGAEEFVAALRGVMRGDSYLSSLIARETLEYLLRQPRTRNMPKHVTQRQVEILQLLAEGRSMKQVAAILKISAATVAFHKYTMMEKLGLETNAALFQYALRNHMTRAQENWTTADLTRTRPMELIEEWRTAKGA